MRKYRLTLMLALLSLGLVLSTQAGCKIKEGGAFYNPTTWQFHNPLPPKKKDVDESLLAQQFDNTPDNIGLPSSDVQTPYGGYTQKERSTIAVTTPSKKEPMIATGPYGVRGSGETSVASNTGTNNGAFPPFGSTSTNPTMTVPNNMLAATTSQGATASFGATQQQPFEGRPTGMPTDAYAHVVNQNNQAMQNSLAMSQNTMVPQNMGQAQPSAGFPQDPNMMLSNPQTVAATSGMPYGGAALGVAPGTNAPSMVYNPAVMTPEAGMMQQQNNMLPAGNASSFGAIIPATSQNNYGAYQNTVPISTTGQSNVPIANPSPNVPYGAAPPVNQQNYVSSLPTQIYSNTAQSINYPTTVQPAANGSTFTNIGTGTGEYRPY